MNALTDLLNMTCQVHETARHAAEHASGNEESIGEVLMHHVRNSHEMEFLSWKLHLPELPTVFGIDLSITKHVIMLWIAALFVFLIFKFGMKFSTPIIRPSF